MYHTFMNLLIALYLIKSMNYRMTSSDHTIDWITSKFCSRNIFFNMLESIYLKNSMSDRNGDIMLKFV